MTDQFQLNFLLPFTFFVLGYFSSIGQNCPPNIDFENGNFNGWTCYTGSVTAVNGQNVITLVNSGGPVPNRHTMYSANSGNVLDPYGGFPVNCPNGSGHSIRLGNNATDGQAEGISYEFTIPPNQNVYSLIYHYAIVIHDPPHMLFQQPRFEIEITNVTDNKMLDCSSFNFIPYDSLPPGFFISSKKQDSTPVWCKNWSAVSVNLNGNAGKTIRLFFKTAYCTFLRHFGYAYIDVNSECNSEFVGATYCPDDITVNVTAPYGYQGYTWFNNNFSQVLGTQQTISFTPPPAAGTAIAVEIIPYNGYGCLDTLYARIIDTLTVVANAGIDTLSCNQNPVPIGTIPKPGLVYSWNPATGLSNPNIANPLASPNTTTTYILTTKHDGGGCTSTDTVTVKSLILDTSIQLIGKATYCINSSDSSVLIVQPTDSIQWFKDDKAIKGANQTHYYATQSGNYHAQLFYKKSCSINTTKQKIFIDKPKQGINYPEQYAVVNYPLQLQARTFGDNAVWSPSTGLDNPISYNPVFKNSSEQLYKISIKTISGCVTVDTQSVKILKELKIFVPSAFTPNNDGLNDFLRPLPIGIKEFTYFRIYNRWGQLLFELKSGSRGWDGTIKGKAQPNQVVIWMAEGIGLDNRIYRQSGTSVLLR